jgi:hypothetical protein
MPHDHEQFEPFGESLGRSAPQRDGAEAGGSTSLRWAGTAVFWALVLTIVTARGLFFEPDFERAFAGVKTFLSSLPNFLS